MVEYIQRLKNLFHNTLKKKNVSTIRKSRITQSKVFAKHFLKFLLIIVVNLKSKVKIEYG